LPLLVGHESAGVIAEVGEGVTTLKPGEYVVVSLLRSCGHCPACVSHAPNLCNGAFPLDSQSRLHTKNGQAIRHGLNTATFAEYAIVDQTQCVKIPNDVPPQSAALLACGVITGVGAVRNTAKVSPGSKVGVVGAGGVGLNAIQGAVLADAQMIVAIDQTDEKLATARTFGATHIIHATNEDPIKVARTLTNGQGLDYVFVTVGNVAAINQAFRMIRRGGTLVTVGLPDTAATAAVNVHALTTGERRILGSFMGSAHLQVDILHLITLYQKGKLKLDELITDCYPLEQINEAIAAMESGKVLRNVIVF
jgi:Zn-dependent alcohol dehydrogenase